MKKTLILVLIVLLLALCGYVVIEGFEIGPIKILSVLEIKSRNEDVKQEAEKASELANSDYKKATSDIESNVKKLEEQKKTYDDMVTTSDGTQIQSVNQIQTYEVEYLWTKVGNHATSEGVTIKMDIAKGTNTVQASDTQTGTYNLNFTVTGQYVGIADFIYSIENDSSLGFKIEEFKLIPVDNNAGQLKATFICKDIAIKDMKESIDSGNSNSTGNNSNTTNTINTTNTTNSTSTENTINTTNSINTINNSKN